jgi:hypothetical protein
VRRPARALVAIALLASACAGQTAPGAGTDSPSPSASPRLDVYEATIRGLAEQEGSAFRTLYVIERICANAGEPSQPSGCGDAFSADEQTTLERRLADVAAEVRFVTSYADADPHQDIFEGREHSVVVRIGPMAAHGDDYWVP